MATTKTITSIEHVWGNTVRRNGCNSKSLWPFLSPSQPDSAATLHILSFASCLNQHDRPDQAKQAPTPKKPHHHKSRPTRKRSHGWWRIGPIGRIFWCVEGWVKGQSSVGTGKIQVTSNISGVEGPYTSKRSTTFREVCYSIYFLEVSLVKEKLQKMGKRDIRDNIPAISEALQTDWTHGPYESAKEGLLQTQCRTLSPWQPLTSNPLEVQLFCRDCSDEKMFEHSIENEREDRRKSYSARRETRKSISINSTGYTANYGTGYGSEGFNVYGASAE